MWHARNAGMLKSVEFEYINFVIYLSEWLIGYCETGLYTVALCKALVKFFPQ